MEYKCEDEVDFDRTKGIECEDERWRSSSVSSSKYCLYFKN